MDYKELKEKVIGCAYRVYNKMGYGFLESVYEKCLMIELEKAGLQAESQKPIIVEYEGESVGEFVAEIGLIPNFAEEKVEVRRKVRSLMNLDQQDK
jgi:hypothetical protein